MKKVVALAWEVIEMQRLIEDQQHEITRLMNYERMYHELMDDSINHSTRMLGGLLGLAMTPGVAEACAKARPLPEPEQTASGS